MVDYPKMITISEQLADSCANYIAWLNLDYYAECLVVFPEKTINVLKFHSVTEWGETVMIFDRDLFIRAVQTHGYKFTLKVISNGIQVIGRLTSQRRGKSCGCSTLSEANDYD